MNPPRTTVPGPGPRLQKLLARRDAQRAAQPGPAQPEHRSWLRRLLGRRAASAPPPDREPSRDLVSDVVKLLNKYDPVGLIDGGAPPDVYAHQAWDIASWMSWVQNEEEMHGLVFETFHTAFHLDMPGEDRDEDEGPPRRDETSATYIPIAHDLMAVRQRYFTGLGAPSGPPLHEE